MTLHDPLPPNHHNCCTCRPIFRRLSYLCNSQCHMHCSHVHLNSGNVLKTVLNKDVETIQSTKRKSHGVPRLFSLIAATVMTLGVYMSRSFIYRELFFRRPNDKRVARSLCQLLVITHWHLSQTNTDNLSTWLQYCRAGPL